MLGSRETFFEGCLANTGGCLTSTELLGPVASPEPGGDPRVVEEWPWVASVGTVIAAVLSGSLDPSPLEVLVVVRSEGSGTPSFALSFVVVFTVALSGGFGASSGAFSVVPGTPSTTFPCLLCLAPSAFRSFRWGQNSAVSGERGSRHTVGSSVKPSTPGLFEGPRVIAPMNWSFLVNAGGNEGNILPEPDGCLDEDWFEVGFPGLFRLVRTVCHSPASSRDD